MRFRVIENAVFGVKPSKIDREKGVIPNVKILGPKSPTHNRRYTEEAIQGAVSLYESARVFINHPPKDQRGFGPINRNIGERWGFIESPRVLKKEGKIGLFGNLRFNPDHAATNQILWHVENEPQNMGLSHVADGESVIEGAERVITKISEVYSVDLVDRAATNAGLFESIDDPSEGGNMGIELKDLTIEQLKKDRPDLFESIGKTAYDEYAAKLAKRTELMEAAADESKLAKDFRTGPLWESLKTCPEAQIKPIVKQLATMFKGKKPSGRIFSEETRPGLDGDDDDESLLEEAAADYWSNARGGGFLDDE